MTRRLPGSETQVTGQTARVCYRDFTGTTWGYRYFTNESAAYRSKEAFVFAGMYINVEVWNVRDQMWIG